MAEIRAISGTSSIARLWWPVAALMLLLVLNLLFTPAFFHLEYKEGRLFGSMVDVLNRAAPMLLAALGMTLVIATAGVDLSVGAVLAMAGSIAALLAAQTSASAPTIVAVTLTTCLVAGAWNGLLIAVLGIQPIVATLVLMVAGRGIAQLLTGGQIITIDHAPLAFIGQGVFCGLPFAVTIVAGMFALTGLFLRLTPARLFIEAVGDNPTAARYAGVSVRGVKSLVYAASGVCAGLAGLIVATNIRAADANNAGLYLELDAILAVVIGGTSLRGGRFSLLGTLVGALIIQTLTTTILTRGIPAQFTLVVKALVVLGVCLLQSEPLRRKLPIGRAPR